MRKKVFFLKNSKGKIYITLKKTVLFQAAKQRNLNFNKMLKILKHFSQ